jgi:hypothetical protein
VKTSKYTQAGRVRMVEMVKSRIEGERERGRWEREREREWKRDRGDGGVAGCYLVFDYE